MSSTCVLCAAFLSSTFNYQTYISWYDANHFEPRYDKRVRTFVSIPTSTGLDPHFGSWLSTPVPTSLVGYGLCVRLRNDHTLQHNASHARVYVGRFVGVPNPPDLHGTSCIRVARSASTSTWSCRASLDTPQHITVAVPIGSSPLPPTTKPLHISYDRMHGMC